MFELIKHNGMPFISNENAFEIRRCAIYSLIWIY